MNNSSIQSRFFDDLQLFSTIKSQAVNNQNLQASFANPKQKKINPFTSILNEQQQNTPFKSVNSNALIQINYKKAKARTPLNPNNKNVHLTLLKANNKNPEFNILKTSKSQNVNNTSIVKQVKPIEGFNELNEVKSLQLVKIVCFDSILDQNYENLNNINTDKNKKTFRLVINQQAVEQLVKTENQSLFYQGKDCYFKVDPVKLNLNSESNFDPQSNFDSNQYQLPENLYESHFKKEGRSSQNFAFCSIVGKAKTGKSFLLNQLFKSQIPTAQSFKSKMKTPQSYKSQLLASQSLSQNLQTMIINSNQNQQLQTNQIQQFPANPKQKTQSIESQLFSVDHTIAPCTQGIWISNQRIKLQQGQLCQSIILIDTQGFGSYHSTNEIDYKLMILSILLSDVVCYNSVGPIDQNTLNGMALATNISELVKSKASTKSSVNFQEFPELLWLLRDFNLQFSTKDKKKITEDQYLQRCLSSQQLPSENQQIKSNQKDKSNQYKLSVIDKKEKVRSEIKQIFKNRKCSSLVLPFDDDGKIRKQFKQDLNKTKNQLIKLLSIRNQSLKNLNGRSKVQNFIQKLRIYVEYLNLNNQNDSDCGPRQQSPFIFPKFQFLQWILVKNQIIAQFNEAQKSYDKLFIKYKNLLSTQKLSSNILHELSSYQNVMRKLTQIRQNFSNQVSEEESKFENRIIFVLKNHNFGTVNNHNQFYQSSNIAHNFTFNSLPHQLCRNQQPADKFLFSTDSIIQKKQGQTHYLFSSLQKFKTIRRLITHIKEGCTLSLNLILQTGEKSKSHNTNLKITRALEENLKTLQKNIIEKQADILNKWQQNISILKKNHAGYLDINTKKIEKLISKVNEKIKQIKQITQLSELQAAYKQALCFLSKLNCLQKNHISKSHISQPYLQKHYLEQFKSTNSVDKAQEIKSYEQFQLMESYNEVVSNTNRYSNSVNSMPFQINQSPSCALIPLHFNKFQQTKTQLELQYLRQKIKFISQNQDSNTKNHDGKLQNISPTLSQASNLRSKRVDMKQNQMCKQLKDENKNKIGHQNHKQCQSKEINRQMNQNKKSFQSKYSKCYNCQKSFYIPYIIIQSPNKLNLSIFKTINKSKHSTSYRNSQPSFCQNDYIDLDQNIHPYFYSNNGPAFSQNIESQTQTIIDQSSSNTSCHNYVQKNAKNGKHGTPGKNGKNGKNGTVSPNNQAIKLQFIIQVELNKKVWFVRRKLKDFIELQNILNIMFSNSQLDQRHPPVQFQSQDLKGKKRQYIKSEHRKGGSTIKCLKLVQNENKAEQVKSVSQKLNEFLVQMKGIQYVVNSRIFQKFIKINKQYLML